MTARTSTAAHRRKVRFALEAADAVSAAVGEGRVGLRFSLAYPLRYISFVTAGTRPQKASI